MAKLISLDIQDVYNVEVEEQGYWEKGYADKRAKHIISQDGVEAWVYPVRFYWPFQAQDPVPPPVYLPVGPLTTKPGLELHAYHVPGVSPQAHFAASEQPLSQIVSDVWTSWRQQQADAGNLDEAGREQPDIEKLEALYEETTPVSAAKQTQLSLPGI